MGLRHAADPDHVVAIAAITARTRRVLAAAWLGVIWGLGHTLTLFLVGASIILFNLAVPAGLGLSLEFAVALVLIVVGLLNLGSRSGERERASAFSFGQAASLPALRAFVVGLIHGLAGSASVALLVLATVRNAWWACGYLLLFGVGTLLGMTVITTGIARPLSAAVRRWHHVGRGVRFATGALSVGFGVWLVYHVGWQGGLFLSTPNWEPR